MHRAPGTADRTPRTLGFPNANVSRGGEAGCAKWAGILLHGAASVNMPDNVSYLLLVSKRKIVS